MQALVRPRLAHRRTASSGARSHRRTSSWTKLIGILLLTPLVSCDDCTERAPNVCCTSDPECAQLGLPPGSASEYSCGQGHVCRDFYCVPAEGSDAGDDGPPRPIVDNGQCADLVFGQETFTTADENHGGLSARSLRTPVGVTFEETGRLWVLDWSNRRALMWSTSPPKSFAEAALVVGALDFTSVGGVCGPATFFASYSQLAAKGGKLVIPAGGCHRVMIWSPIPTTNGGATGTILGQASFNEMIPGNGAADLDDPGGVWTDGTRVAVADTGNSRVLIWTSFPTTNKQPADIVLGQPGFGTSGFPNTPTGATMRFPQSVYSDGVRLFVADSENARVLVWRSFPTASGQPADLAIGQPDLTSDGIGHGRSELWRPGGVTTIGDHLFIADANNNRVLVFSPIPTASGRAASFVLGQPSFETTGFGTTQETLHQPTSLVVGGNKLYVTDTQNHRVLRFDLKL